MRRPAVEVARLDRNGTCGLVFFQAGTLLHRDQDDPEVVMLDEGLCTVASVSPSIFVLQSIALVAEIELQNWPRQWPLLRAPVRTQVTGVSRRAARARRSCRRRSAS